MHRPPKPWKRSSAPAYQYLDALPREEEADYHTVGGMVMDNLGRVPAAGDRFDWEGYTFEVLDMDGRRVDKVLVTSSPGRFGPEHTS